jgi:hypothetical protein
MPPRLVPILRTSHCFLGRWSARLKCHAPSVHRPTHTRSHSLRTAPSGAVDPPFTAKSHLTTDVTAILEPSRAPRADFTSALTQARSGCKALTVLVQATDGRVVTTTADTAARPVRSSVRASRSPLRASSIRLPGGRTVALDNPTTPSSSAFRASQTRKMRRGAREQLCGGAEPAIAVCHPRPVRQSHEPSKQAVQLTTAATSGKPISGGGSERTRAGVPATVDAAVVTEWLKRQCEAYGHGPTITNPQTLRRIATLALSGLDDEATSTPSASSRRRQGRTRGRAAGGS